MEAIKDSVSRSESDGRLRQRDDTPLHANQVIVDRVSHRFAERVLAIDEMNFRVGGGEFVVIVGPSGCGKTTILNIIAGLIAKQSGVVTIGAQAPKAGRHDIAYMFAQDALLPWRRVIDNVVFGVEISRGSPANAGPDSRARPRHSCDGGPIRL